MLRAMLLASVAGSFGGIFYDLHACVQKLGELQEDARIRDPPA